MKRFAFLVITFMMLFSNFKISFAGAVSKIQESGTTIVNAIAWCGYAVSVLMMVYIGIKYVLGSADSKANMKSAITGYLIGAAVVFSASTIMTVVVNLIPDNNMNNAEKAASNIVNAGFGIMGSGTSGES